MVIKKHQLEILTTQIPMSKSIDPVTVKPDELSKRRLKMKSAMDTRLDRNQSSSLVSQSKKMKQSVSLKQT